MKPIVHVFSTYEDMRRHIHALWNDDNVAEIRRHGFETTYTERNGMRHHCFTPDDVYKCVSLEIHDYKIHIAAKSDYVNRLDEFLKSRKR